MYIKTAFVLAFQRAVSTDKPLPPIANLIKFKLAELNRINRK